MKVIFVDPITGIGCKNGIEYSHDNPDDFSKIPNIPGIYIYGLKIFITEENKEKFVPLYIGIRSNLQARIKEHYKNIKSNGNGKQEMFDFSNDSYSINDIIEKYSAIKQYDEFSAKRNKINLIKEIDHLLYFQNTDFFNKIFKTSCFSDSEKGQKDAIELLKKHNTYNPNIGEHVAKLVETKERFDNNFYFIYSTSANHNLISEDSDFHKEFPIFKDAPNQKALNQIEYTTKLALKKDLNIHAISNAKGELNPMEIDLSNIQDVLINLGNHSFGNPYNPSLIIKP